VCTRIHSVYTHTQCVFVCVCTRIHSVYVAMKRTFHHFVRVYMCVYVCVCV